MAKPGPPFPSRRGALAMVGALLFAGLTAAAIKFPRPAPTIRTRQLALLSLLGRQKAPANQVGRAFLGQMPEQTDARKLVRSILADIPELQGGLQDANSLRAVIKRRISQDFAENRTVTLDGWIMSLTEARLCALHVFEHFSPI